MAQAQSVGQTAGTAPAGGGFLRVPGTDPNADPNVDPSLVNDDPNAQSSSAEDGSQAELGVAQQEAEAQARTHGWVNQDEWNAQGHDPSRWRSAAEFLDVRNNIISVTREDNRRLQAKVTALETKLEARERAETEARLRFTGDSLRTQLEKAREEHDTAREAQILAQMVDHGVEVRTTTQQQAIPKANPELQQQFVEFVNANPILRNDRDLSVDFMLELRRIAEVAPQMDMNDALTQAKRRVMQANPLKFGRRPANGNAGLAMVETGGNSGTTSSGRSWGDLKPDVRDRAEKDISNKKYTKEDFLAQCEPEHFRR